jgi:hypothetical protein
MNTAGAYLASHPEASVGTRPSSLVRQQLGCHFAFILLIGGFGLQFKDGGGIFGFFRASIAIERAISYLLFYIYYCSFHITVTIPAGLHAPLLVGNSHLLPS